MQQQSGDGRQEEVSDGVVDRMEDQQGGEGGAPAGGGGDCDDVEMASSSGSSDVEHD
jgi:hypothetical protein